jgi:rod shape determining protein RodA
MKWWKNLDWLIMTALLIIFSLGGLVLFSLDSRLFFNQLIFFILSLIPFFLLASFDYRIFKGFYFYLYGASLFLLLLTFALGRLTRGVTRWIAIGGFNLQPAELVKPLLILAFSSSILRFNLKKIKNIALYLFFLLLPAILVFKQPDLGNSLVLLVIWLAVILQRGLKKKYIFLGLVVFFAFLPLSWRVLKPYQKERIISFANPESDPLDSGYNLIQARIAVGSGQFLGKGLGGGSQSQLRFLPERHSDFIFACLGEELGFVGASFLILVFLILILRILLLSQKSLDIFGSLICIGTAGMLFFQVFINIGMNLGLVPITGLTLPLVSYGGSSLLATMISLGLVQSVARQLKRETLIEIK